jgi:hypothetical protein
VRQRAIAITAQENIPSMAIGPIKVCILGVKRKGTVSLLWKKAFVDAIAGMSSEPQILPVSLAMNILCGNRLLMLIM